MGVLVSKGDSYTSQVPWQVVGVRTEGLKMLKPTSQWCQVLPPCRLVLFLWVFGGSLHPGQRAHQFRQSGQKLSILRSF